MDCSSNDDPTTVAEGGFKAEPSTVDSITNLFHNLMDYAHNDGKLPEASELVSKGLPESWVISPATSLSLFMIEQDQSSKGMEVGTGSYLMKPFSQCMRTFRGLTHLLLV